MRRILSFLILASMLIFTACGNMKVAETQGRNQVDEVEQKNALPEGTSEQEMLFPVSGHEQARDIAVVHVAELAGSPIPVGEWVFQDQTLQNPEDGLSWLFTNGPWVVQVSTPALTPDEPVVYSVKVDHMSAVIRWEGTIDSFGNIVETNFIQGSQPESPEKPGEPSWVGVVISNPPGSQFDDFFQVMNREDTRYGIDGTDDRIKSQLNSYRDTGVVIQVWGILQKDVPDVYGAQILVTRIELY